MVGQEQDDLRDQVKVLLEQVEALASSLTELADGLWDANERQRRRIAYEESQRQADYRELERRLAQIENDR